MINGLRFSLAVLILFATLSSSCTGGNTGIDIEEPWARPAEKGANTAVYLRITNLDSDDTWIDAESPQAGMTELHRSILQADGTAKMVQQDQIALPQNQMVELVSGGLHVMLIDLKQALEPGDTINLSLVFNQHENVNIIVPVKTP